MKTKEEIKKIIENYNNLYEKIQDIVGLHGKVDDCYYEINDIEYSDTCLIISVEFYKWQDNNHEAIYIELDLLTDANAYVEFKNEMDHKLEQKELEKQAKLEIERKRKVQEAIKFIEENGF